MILKNTWAPWAPEKPYRKLLPWNVAYYGADGQPSRVLAQCLTERDAARIAAALNADTAARDLGYVSAADALYAMDAMRDHEQR